MRKIIITNIALALTLGVLYTGCKKEEEFAKIPTTAEDTSTENENSVAENSLSEIFRSVSEVSENGNLRSACATVTIDSVGLTSWPKTVTIDYGTGANCSGKKGKIKAVFTGRFGTQGTIITITDSNYYHKGNKISLGIHTITNNGTNFQGHKSFSVNLISGILTIPGGKVSWNSTRTITWIEGDTTLNPLDDVYSITGTTTGTSSKGEVFSSTIITPLRVATSCPWIESGVIVMTGKNNKTRTIDFGTSGCDNQATITTFNGKVYNITM